MHLEHLYIETERLILRPHILEDVQASYEMNLDVRVSRYTGDGGVVPRETIERRIVEDVLGDYQKYGYGRQAVVWKATGQFIGFAGLKYLEDLQEIDLGYRLCYDFWGKGIATEAANACLEMGFNHLKLPRVIGMVLPENKTSVRVLEKLGFLFENCIEEDGMTVEVYGKQAPQNG